MAAKLSRIHHVESRAVWQNLWSGPYVVAARCLRHCPLAWTFSLRTLIVSISVLACCAGYFGSLVRAYARETAAINTIDRWGLNVDLDNTAPSWLRKLVGPRGTAIWNRAVLVRTGYHLASPEQWVVPVLSLHSVKQVTINQMPSEPQRLAELSRMPSLECLELCFCNAEVLRACSTIPIPRLVLFGGVLSPEKIRIIAGYTKLTRLECREADIRGLGAADWAVIAGLRNLEELDLTYSKLNKAALEALVTVPRLRRVWLNSTYETDEGIAKFRAARPDVRLIVD